MSHRHMRLAAALVAYMLAAASSLAEDRPPVPTPPDYIGRAHMLDDGTLELFLVAHGPGGLVGHGLLVYRPGDPQYKVILAHIGPIKPGEDRPVRAWPDEK